MRRKLFGDESIRVRLPAWLYDAIEEMAQKNDTTLSQVVREALKIVFAEVKPEEDLDDSE